MPRSKTKPLAGSMPSRTSRGTSRGSHATTQSAQWPEVLTLTEVAAYMRVDEADVIRMVGPHGLPGRLIGSEWRFSRTAVDQWLRIAPEPSSREFFVSLTGVWKDDPDAEEMLWEIYRQRGRTMTEESP